MAFERHAMNILHVIASMDPAQGGLAQAVRNTVPALTSLGATNEVLCLDAPSADFVGRDPFPVHAIGPARGPYSYGAALRPWLMANLARFDAVIAHGLWLHNSAGTYGAVRAFARLHRGRPAPRFYVMPHGMLDPYFQRAPGRRLKAVRNVLVWKLFEGQAVNGADGVLFTCAQELLLAREPFSPYRPRRELDVGLGIEAPPAEQPSMAPAFAAACPGVAGRPYLLFLARLHEKKGTDLLVQAYLQLRKTRPAMPALVVAGPGLDSPHGRAVQAMAGEGDDIHFPGMLQGDAKWGALYGCDAFVLPSHQENFGIAVVEALACGRPVLISNQVNIWRECEPGGLVDEDTEAGTLRLLQRWLELGDAERAGRASKARAVYAQHFAVERAAARLLAAVSGTDAEVTA